MNDNFNKVFLLGNVGDIKFISYDNGSKEFASLSLATSKYWNDTVLNERKSRTEWHRIVVYNENLVSILKKKNVKKGSKLFIEGSLTNRKWVDQKGNNRLTTEIILQGYSANLLILPVHQKNHNESGDNNDSSEGGSGFNKYNKHHDSTLNDSDLDDFDKFLNESNFDDEDNI